MSHNPSNPVTRAEIEIQNHQQAIDLSEADLEWLSRAAEQAWMAVSCVALVSFQPELVAEDATKDRVTLDVALVDDEASAQVHLDFMSIAGATDVITFEHGELVIGAEVAQRQAAEHDEPLLRELLRYVVHGFLHLCGYRDDSEAARTEMCCHQEEIVSELWRKEPR